MGGLRRWGVSKTCGRGSGKFPTINDARPGGGIGLDGAGGNWGEGAGGATVKSGAGMAVEGAEVSSMEFPATAESPLAEPGDSRREGKAFGTNGSASNAEGGVGQDTGLGTGLKVSGVAGDGAPSQRGGSVAESATADGGSSAAGGGSSPACDGSSAEGGGSSAAGGGSSAACDGSSAAGGGNIWPCIGRGSSP